MSGGGAVVLITKDVDWWALGKRTHDAWRCVWRWRLWSKRFVPGLVAVARAVLRMTDGLVGEWWWMVDKGKLAGEVARRAMGDGLCVLADGWWLAVACLLVEIRCMMRGW